MRHTAILILLFAAAVTATAKPVPADAPLPIKVTASNTGRCGWACLESLLRHHGHAKAAAAAADKTGPMALQNNGIADCFQLLLAHNRTDGSLIPPHHLDWPDDDGAKPWHRLNKSIKGRLGSIAIVQFPKESKAHAVIVVGIDDQSVSYIDPSDAGLRRLDRSVFAAWWTGWTVTIYPDRESQEKNR